MSKNDKSNPPVLIPKRESTKSIIRFIWGSPIVFLLFFILVLTVFLMHPKPVSPPEGPSIDWLKTSIEVSFPQVDEYIYLRTINEGQDSKKTEFVVKMTNQITRAYITWQKKGENYYLMGSGIID